MRSQTPTLRGVRALPSCPAAPARGHPVRQTVKGAGEPVVSADPAIRRDIPDATVARLPEYLRALSRRRRHGSVLGVLGRARRRRRASGRPSCARISATSGRTASGGSVTRSSTSPWRSRAPSGLTQDWPVAIVGMGNLGRALAAYSGFATGGFHIAALFDDDPELVGETVLDVAIVDRSSARAAPSPTAASPSGSSPPRPASAQQVCDALVEAGISSMLNFAPLVLAVPAERRRAPGRPLDRAARPRLPRAAQELAPSGARRVGGGVA